MYLLNIDIKIVLVIHNQQLKTGIILFLKIQSLVLF